MTNALPRSEHPVSLIYDGPLLQAGRMPVRQLAPALLAFGDAVNAASFVAFPGARLPGVEIVATERGSFAITLHIIDAGVFEETIEVLSGDIVSAALNGAGLIGLVFGAIVGVRKLWRRFIVRREDNAPGPGQIRLTLDDGTVLEIPALVLALMQSPVFRGALEDMTEPLRSGLANVLQLSDPTRATVVTDEDAQAFVAPEPEQDVVTDEVVPMLVTLANIGFGGRKWRVNDGESTFWVDIEDSEFLGRVERDQERFGANDALRVQMRVRQVRDFEGLHLHRTILQVVEHIRGVQDVPLPFPDGDEDD